MISKIFKSAALAFCFSLCFGMCSLASSSNSDPEGDVNEAETVIIQNFHEGSSSSGSSGSSSDSDDEDSPVTYEGTTIKYHVTPGTDNLTVVSIDSSAKTIKIPDYVIGENGNTYIVTAIGNDALRPNTTSTSLTIGDNILMIGDRAFKNASVLKTLKTGKMLANIGTEAFRGNTRLETANLGASIQAIGPYAFAGDTSLKSVTIGNMATAIGNGAFMDCINLTSAKLGDNVSSIGSEAFRGCVSLKDISIPFLVTKIEPSTFADDPHLAKVSFGARVNSIGPGAFQGSGITTLDIPDNVQVIQQSAFSNCYHLTSVNFGTGINIIEMGAFSGDSLLSNISFKGGALAHVGIGAFSECSPAVSFSINANKSQYQSMSAVIKGSVVPAGSKFSRVKSDKKSSGSSKK